MFSSNQIFSVSCDERQLPGVIKLVLSMDRVSDHKHKLAYQKIADGRIAIGWFFNDCVEGWKPFEFDCPDEELLLAVIKQYVRAYPSDDYEGGDGSHHPGYLVEVADRSFASEYKGIKNSMYAIFTVRAFNCFYHK